MFQDYKDLLSAFHAHGVRSASAVAMGYSDTEGRRHGAAFHSRDTSEAGAMGD